MSHKNTLVEKIKSKTAKIGVVGAGYVGLPLAVEFAEVGFHVVLVDVSQEKVDSVNRGKSYIGDVTSGQLQEVTSDGRLVATTEYADLSVVDTISICVPTPLRKTRDPDMSYVLAATNSISEISKAGILVTLESTTYPGTTQEIVVPKLEEQGFTIGEDIFVAFSPERIDPGNATFGVKNTPRVVGGSTPACQEIAVELYSTIIDNVCPVSSPTAAEMVKLLENTFRAVNIGFINEFALMCDRLDVDVWEIIDAANTKPFGFMRFTPGPGLGGHCIPVDPHYLSWKLRALNYTARFIELASEINTGMPFHVVDKVTEALNDFGKPVRGSNIVVLGVAYKPNVSDVRESPALDVIHILLDKGADIVYHDPYVEDLRLGDGRTMETVTYSDELLQGADCVVVLTDHQDYDWAHVIQNSKVIVDTRRAIEDEQFNSQDHIRRI